MGRYIDMHGMNREVHNFVTTDIHNHFSVISVISVTSVASSF
jgi:hypothetical protein